MFKVNEFITITRDEAEALKQIMTHHQKTDVVAWLVEHVDKQENYVFRFRDLPAILQEYYGYTYLDMDINDKEAYAIAKQWLLKLRPCQAYNRKISFEIPNSKYGNNVDMLKNIISKSVSDVHVGTFAICYYPTIDACKAMLDELDEWIMLDRTLPVTVYMTRKHIYQTYINLLKLEDYKKPKWYEGI